MTAGFYLGGGNVLEHPWAWLGTGVAVCFYYESGMVLNDLLDQATDFRERPHRPIPSGRIRVREAWLIYVLLSLAATLLVALVIPNAIFSAAALFSLILLYNWTHRWLTLSPVLMGACRGCVYLLAASAAGWTYSSKNLYPLLLPMTIFLATYVTLLATVARSELLPTPSPLQWSALGLCFLAFLIPSQTLPFQESSWSWAATTLGSLWVAWVIGRVMLKRIPLIGAVGKLLAAISLFDGLSLAIAGVSGGVLLAGGCFVGTLAWHKKVRGT